MSRAPRWPVLLVWAACSGGAPPAAPIQFTEVLGPRVPTVTQDRYVPNDGFNSGLGAAVGDVDGDGRPDVYLAGGGLYLNRPDPAGFRLEAAPGATPPPDFTLLGAAFGDYDRDGHLDLALCGQGGVRLWHNDGTGHFTDVTAAAGVAGAPDDVSLSVAWGDLDGDGYPDLAVADYGLSGHANDAQPSRLYLNHRDGTFVELTAPLGGLDVRAWVVALADLDGDGRLDLFLGDDADIRFLDLSKPRHDLVLLNRGLDAGGQLSLVESSAALGLGSPHATMTFALGNAARGPGWDIFRSDISAGWLFRAPAPGQPFQDITADSGIYLAGPKQEQWWQWGSAFADLDGDGYEDLLVGQAPIFPGQAGTDTVGPLLLRNQGTRFQLSRYAFGGPMNGRAVVLADLDGDGDDDAIVTPFFDRFRFFENTSPPRHFVRIELDPTVSAPGAAGAVVVARSGPLVQKRMRVAGGQPHGSGEDIVDFALGSAAAADLTITWPSGAIQAVPGVSAGSLQRVSEPRWLTLGDPRPPADGQRHVTVTIDARAAGLGGVGSLVHLGGAGLALDATCDASGVASFDLAPRSAPGTLQLTVSIDGHELPAHPALDYQ